MEFKVTIYNADGHKESGVLLPDYYQLHRALEKCKIKKFSVELL